jgi:hypothetical protein
MNPELYRVIHVSCALLLYLSLGAVVFGPRDEKPSKLAMALHGLALLLMVVAGVGVVHKDPDVDWGNWLYAKIGCWLLVGALPVLVRKGTVPRFFGLLLAIAAGGAAAWLAIVKPF